MIKVKILINNPKQQQQKTLNLMKICDPNPTQLLQSSTKTQISYVKIPKQIFKTQDINDIYFFLFSYAPCRD